MGIVTRQELMQLIQDFETHIVPTATPARIQKCLQNYVESMRSDLAQHAGTPSVQLRSLARVLKHYLDTPKTKYAIQDVPCALWIAQTTQDATQAIKKARNKDFYVLFPNVAEQSLKGFKPGQPVPILASDSAQRRATA